MLRFLQDECLLNIMDINAVVSNDKKCNIIKVDNLSYVLKLQGLMKRNGRNTLQCLWPVDFSYN